MAEGYGSLSRGYRGLGSLGTGGRGRGRDLLGLERPTPVGGGQVRRGGLFPFSENMGIVQHLGEARETPGDVSFANKIMEFMGSRGNLGAAQRHIDTRRRKQLQEAFYRPRLEAMARTV